MASSLPAKLKIPAITPFVNRAAQLEKFKPIVSYWCDYYVVNQILSKGLHSADEECTTFTTALMDKLERVKTDNAANDAITDDIAAKAYIEQFAMETFDRADTAIRTNKASRQTIDTFQAASTFLDLLSVWNPLDPEIVAKIKYSKFHALRIAKAVKAGEDPNASNPVDDEQQAAADPDLATQDTSQEAPTSIYRPPTVESAPESKQPSRPTSVPPITPFAPPPVGTPSAPLRPQPNHDVSPVEPTDDGARQSSIGGGYFPAVPTFTSESTASAVSTVGTEPTAPGASEAPSSDLFTPAGGPPDVLPSPRDYYGQQFQPSQAPPAAPVAAVPAAPPVSAFAPPPRQIVGDSYRTDDESVMLAQKHAKWAISALNFEDVPTAVKELQLALQTLGAL